MISTFSIQFSSTKVLTTLGFTFILIAFTPLMAQVPAVKTYHSREIIDKMLVAVKNLQTIQYTLKATERRNGSLRESEQLIKMNMTPFKMYVYVRKPDKGIEVLYRQGTNNNKAVVHPKSYSPVSLNLDPTGDMLRNGNHHTIFEANLNYITGIIQDAYKKAGSNFETYFMPDGSVSFEGKDCFKIVINYPVYKYTNYTVKPGEDIITIARKNYLSEFKIKEKNNLNSYQDVKPGQVILLPNAYAKKTTLYIDKKTYLPVVQIIYDELGLFEKYELWDIKINPLFKPEEFTKEYKDYNF